MKPNRIREIIAGGGKVLNAWCTIPDSYVAEAVASQGFESATVDLQHGPIGYQAAFHMLQAISATPSVPMARVPWNEPSILMKVLDSGAYGLICPMVNTGEEARRFVGACRYPPQGFRSYGPNRAVYYAGADYAQHANREIILLAQVETREAVANLEEILAVPGLDGVYVGPGDLSMSMGAPASMAPTDPEVVSAISHVLRGTLSRGLIAAVHTDGPATVLRRYAEGFHLCSIQTEMRMLVDATKAAVGAVKAGLAQK